MSFTYIQVNIMDTAFVKWLRQQDFNARVSHLQDCLNGESPNMVWELIEHYGTHDVWAIAHKLESTTNGPN